jgi:hypothetical protein
MTDPPLKQNPGHQGLVEGQPFLVIQIFDHEGYHSSVVAVTEEEVRTRARLRVHKSFVAFTLPFPGTWDGSLPDVSMPMEWKEALASINRPGAEIE